LGEVFKTRETALLSTTSTVDFVQCTKCDFVYNRAYEYLDYKAEYEVSREASGFFTNYLVSLVKKLLISLEDFKLKSVVEVGAGDGHFAREFVKSQRTHYVAVDTSYLQMGTPVVDEVIDFIGGTYNEKMTLCPDLVIFRHVLEHIPNVKEFINSVTHEQPEFVFIEVPCFEFVSKDNYHYFSNDHCSYFTKNSLNLLMTQFGYSAVFNEYAFNDEYIISLWKKNQSILTSTEASEKTDCFLYESFTEWKYHLSTFFEEKTFLWSASGKGRLLLIMLEVGYKKSEYVVDINPKMQGHYLPVTGQHVISPKMLSNLECNRVLVINSLYLEEIKQNLKELDIDCEVVSLFK